MIDIKDLNISFGDKSVIKDLNYKICEKDFVVITGESGCGKTTLLNCLSFLEKYDSGDIVFEGKSYNKMKTNSKTRILKNSFGIIFQDFGMIDDKTVYENISFVETNKSKIREMLKSFNLDVKLSTPVSVLSGGEKQRLALVRVALKKCRIIFADEPTGNLDEENSMALMKYLESMNKKGVTVVMVTHDKSLIKYSNKHLVLT